MDNIIEYSRYKDSQVRALVWSLLSPGLVNESGTYPACVSSQWCRNIYETIRPFLEQLDKQPEPLKHWLENYKSWRLGIRFEAYWAFILEQLQKQSQITRYISHIQIAEQINQGIMQKTRGEIDFVYLDSMSGQQVNHLEIAVKFYLLKPDEFGFERLIGPNGGDWFERKLEHLFNKQLPLSETLVARQKIAEQLLHSDANKAEQITCHHQGIMKGMIFFPLTGENDDETYLNNNEIKRINPECLTGTWGTIKNWYLSDPGELGRWVMLDKLDWLVPQMYQSLEEHLYTAKEMSYKLKIHFLNTRRSVLIARLEYDDKLQLWLEQQRVMVVDKYWPSFKRNKQ